MLSSSEEIEPEGSAQEERRYEPRHRNVFKACAVRHGELLFPAVLRNISENGAQIELPQGGGLDPGSQLTYFWDGIDEIDSTVIWRDGNMLGLRNTQPCRISPRAFPARLVRIPCESTARAIVRGDSFQISLVNASQSGVSVRGLPNLPVGTLLTLIVNGLEFCNASIRWGSDGAQGIRLARALSVGELASLLGLHPSRATRPNAPAVSRTS